MISCEGSVIEAPPAFYIIADFNGGPVTRMYTMSNENWQAEEVPIEYSCYAPDLQQRHVTDFLLE